MTGTFYITIMSRLHPRLCCRFN